MFDRIKLNEMKLSALSLKKIKRQFLDTPSRNFFLTVAAQGTEFCGYPLLKTAGDDEK